ncbi:MAG TPA: VWA domain-containing protein [Candidatus Acidoferrales bacterium]|nr:VWA domain-containing protein [Candidatus Acidoferrales bacterium]
MPIMKCLAVFVVFCATAVVAQTPPAPSPKAAAPAQQPPTAANTLKTQTRLIAIDIVVTDSHGAPVRGLKKEDFQIFEEHNRQQDIAQFRFVDRSATPAAPAGPITPVASPTLFTNGASTDRSIAPTVLLMDSLNTEMSNQMQVRQHMLSLLRTLPPTTPVAVFSLGHTLHVVQSFSTDPKILRDAINRTLRDVPIDQNPQDDASSPSNQALDWNGGQETQAIQGLEDFEAMTYEAQMALRVDETTDAMSEIAKYLGPMPGRKNLIWFSEAFPIWIEPSADFGTDPFQGSAAYNDKVRAAAEALTDARIAVYPVDAKGLSVDQLYSTTQNPHINQQNPGAGFGGQIMRQNTQHLDAQATMDNIAETTGGRSCKNTNDLSGCVQTALNDGSVYYELAYYPQGIDWDNRFHEITVKTTEKGLKLAYRRGYFATNSKGAGEQQNPEELLKQSCMRPLPSTSIAMTVQPVAPQPSAGQAPQDAPARYFFTVSPNALSFEPALGVRQMGLEMAICEFDPKGDNFQFFTRDLSRPVPDDLYKSYQDHGIRNIFDYSAKPEDQRLRFAVLDTPSGSVGSVDVPAHPHEFASVPGVSASGPAFASAAGPAPPKQPAQIITKINFKGSVGGSSSLDWSSGTLTYQGDLGIDQGAPAFFNSLYGEKFQCQGGSLVLKDPTSTAKPSFLFTFHSPAGTGALVELGGDAPAYSGNLQVDASGRAFFDYLWKLCHCQHP